MHLKDIFFERALHHVLRGEWSSSITCGIGHLCWDCKLNQARTLTECLNPDKAVVKFSMAVANLGCGEPILRGRCKPVPSQCYSGGESRCLRSA